MAKLKRELGLFQVTVAGVGVILGAGIYALIGIAAGYAGNAVWLSFLISALVAILTGLSYAELSSMFKGDAAEYDYIKAAMNRKFAFFVAITMILGTIISAATVTLGFAGYFTKLVSIPFAVAAIGLILVLTLVNALGIKQTSIVTEFSTAVEFIGLIIIIILGFKYSGNVNYLEMPKGIEGVFSAAALVFFAFLGFEGIVKLRDETKDPEKTIPKALIYSILISTVLYILVAVSAIGVLGWEKLSTSSAPLASVAAAALGSKAFVVLAIIALFSTSNTVLMTMVAASRQIYGIAKEHSLPKFLSRVSSKRGTPTSAIVITMLITFLFAMVGDIEFIANLTNFLIFLAFAAVNLSLIILRYKYADMHRGFLCPVNIGRFPVVAFLGLISSIGMLIFVLLNIF